MAGNACVLKYSIDNLVIPSIAAVTTTEVAINCPGVMPGDIGVAIPRNAAFTNGLSIGHARCAVAGVLQLPFVNASAGAIDAADTFDFDILVIQQSSCGNRVAT